jgi:uncharacterized protein (DUF488 family)
MTTPRAGALLKRQVALLALVRVLGGRRSRLDFQKLLFLYCQEKDEEAPYDFVPHRFGAFSFSSYADRRRLIDRGLLAADDQDWVLTEAGRQAVPDDAPYLESMGDFARRWNGVSGDALVAETYRRFPYFATRSEIASRVLVHEQDELARIDEARPPIGPAGLVTIGYEGRSLEAYLNLLSMDGVTVLCDVRRNPLSRKYGFSKRALESGCTAVGIRYAHLPQLGIASDQRRNLRTRADYDALFLGYERDYLPHQGEALATIRDWIAAGERVALTCYELHPEQCHRHCVAEALQERCGAELRVRHL